MSTTRTNRELVTRALDELFSLKDLGSIDRYFAEPYLQHNPHLPNGLEAFREFARQAIVANVDFRAERLCVLAEGEFVAVHHRYRGLGPTPLMAVDLFRVEDEKVVEHWDCLEAETAANAAFFERPVPLNAESSADEAEHHRQVAESFIDSFWINGPRNAGKMLAEAVPQGAERLLCSPGAQDKPLCYLRLHRALADGSFVLTQAEAVLAKKTYICYDLFLIEGDAVARYWSVAQEVPSSSAGELGMF